MYCGKVVTLREKVLIQKNGALRYQDWRPNYRCDRLGSLSLATGNTTHTGYHLEEAVGRCAGQRPTHHGFAGHRLDTLLLLESTGKFGLLDE